MHTLCTNSTPTFDKPSTVSPLEDASAFSAVIDIILDSVHKRAIELRQRQADDAQRARETHPARYARLAALFRVQPGTVGARVLPRVIVVSDESAVVTA